jgi:hypothetical protein
MEVPIKINHINRFLLLKLPAAFFAGVRLRKIDFKHCTTTVKYKWINQNPFRSMFWAVQAMAAELSTGALVMQSIQNSGLKISMLLINNKGSYYKKALGRITFICKDGVEIQNAIDMAIKTNEGQLCLMRSTGTDEAGDIVSDFEFEWSIKVK